jgi:sulfur carrier protein
MQPVKTESPSSSAMTTITVNGEPHQLHAGDTLADLLLQLGHAPDSVATAVNGAFVPRGDRAAQALHPGDQITCFQPIVGG